MMNKYLVKALVAKERQPASLRFVPLEIYELWKSHMQSNHHYRISALEVSLWVSADSANARPGAGNNRGERVMEIRFSKKVDGVDVPVERYFLAEELERLLPVFLSHYGIESTDPGAMSRVCMQNGFYLKPEDVFSDDY